MGNLKKKMMYQSKGVKPTQEEFDAATSEQKRELQNKYKDYKISADTPTLADLQAAEKKQLKMNKVKKGKEKKMGGPMLYKKGGFGMLSVNAGVDNNPNPTAADRIVGAKKKKKKGGIRPKKKTMGGMKDMYKEGGIKKSTASEFLEPPSAYNIDN